MKNKTRKEGYYTADTVYGIAFYSEDMDIGIDAMTADDFYDSLSSVEEGDRIYGYFGKDDIEIFTKMQTEYGIDS